MSSEAIEHPHQFSCLRLIANTLMLLGVIGIVLALAGGLISVFGPTLKINGSGELSFVYDAPDFIASGAFALCGSILGSVMLLFAGRMYARSVKPNQRK